MATIITFSPVPATRSQENKTEGAKIILFPGIRYERICEEPVRKPRSPKRRKKA